MGNTSKKCCPFWSNKKDVNTLLDKEGKEVNIGGYISIRFPIQPPLNSKKNSNFQETRDEGTPTARKLKKNDDLSTVWSKRQQLETYLDEENSIQFEALIRQVEQQREINHRVDQFPYDCIGLVYTQFQKTKAQVQLIGTGFLVSSRFVITAAHNVVDKSTGIKFQDLAFYPKINGFKVDNPTQCFKVANSDFSPNFLETVKLSKGITCQDYALLLLQTPIQKSQYISIGYNFNKEVEAKLFGYPMDLIATLQRGEFKQFGMKGNILKIENGAIYYNMDTNSGQSGSPILIQIAANKPMAIGIHSNYSRKENLNAACHFTAKTMENLNKMAGKMTDNKYFINSMKMQHVKPNRIEGPKKQITPTIQVERLLKEMRSIPSFAKLGNQNIELLLYMAKQYYYNGQYDKSQQKLEEGIQIIKKTKDNSSLDQFYNYLGKVFLNKGLYSLSKEKFEDYKQLCISKHGIKSIEVADAIISIGNIYNQQKFKEHSRKLAMKNYDQAFEICTEIKHKGYVMAKVLGNIAIVNRRQKNYSEALLKFHQTLKIKKEVFGPSHLEVSTTLLNISLVHYDQLELNQWLDFHVQSLIMMRQIKLSDHPTYAARKSNLKQRILNVINHIDSKNIKFYRKVIDVFSTSFVEEKDFIAYLVKRFKKSEISTDELN